MSYQYNAGELNSISLHYKLLESIYKNNDKEIQSILDDSRVDPTYNNNEVIKLAVSMGRFNIVKILLNDSRILTSLIKRYSKGVTDMQTLYDISKGSGNIPLQNYISVRYMSDYYHENIM